MSLFLEVFNWWYSVVCWGFLNDKVLATFIFSMNKTRALPFAKTFNIPLYKDNSGFGLMFGKIVKFWWISLGTIISIFKVVLPILLLVLLAILPFIPVYGVIRFVFRI